MDDRNSGSSGDLHFWNGRSMTSRECVEEMSRRRRVLYSITLPPLLGTLLIPLLEHLFYEDRLYWHGIPRFGVWFVFGVSVLVGIKIYRCPLCAHFQWGVKGESASLDRPHEPNCQRCGAQLLPPLGKPTTSGWIAVVIVMLGTVALMAWMLSQFFRPVLSWLWPA